MPKTILCHIVLWTYKFKAVFDAVLDSESLQEPNNYASDIALLKLYTYKFISHFNSLIIFLIKLLKHVSEIYSICDRVIAWLCAALVAGRWWLVVKLWHLHVHAHMLDWNGPKKPEYRISGGGAVVYQKECKTILLLKIVCSLHGDLSESVNISLVS